MKKISFVLLLCAFSSSLFAEPIDRCAVVGRHAITSNEVNLEIPLGNGEFCFNVDRTGLQTTRGNTMSHWGWHSFPLPKGFTPADVPPTGTFQQGRNQPHEGDNSFTPEKEPLRNWLRQNPHRADLGRIRLVRVADASSFEAIADSEIQTSSGVLTSGRGCIRRSFSSTASPFELKRS